MTSTTESSNAWTRTPAGRAGDVLGDVVGALLLQVLAGPPWPLPHRRLPGWSWVQVRTPASSISATAGSPPSGSKATTTRLSSSPFRAPPPESGESSATSSLWGRGRSPSGIRSASVPRTSPTTAFCSQGVVAGIASYGNAVGVPTVGGELAFAEHYSANPLVNVMCLGLAPA